MEPGHMTASQEHKDKVFKKVEDVRQPRPQADKALVASAHGNVAILLTEFSSVFTQKDVASITWLGPGEHRFGEAVAQNLGHGTYCWSEVNSLKASGLDRMPNHEVKDVVWKFAPILALPYNERLVSGLNECSLHEGRSVGGRQLPTCVPYINEMPNSLNKLRASIFTLI